MLGAILGDMIGSYYEAHPDESWEPGQELMWGNYSDDTVLTIATMAKLLHGGSYAEAYRRFYRNDPERDYGERFAAWASSEDMPAYGSYGNGAAMRVSPIGLMASDEVWLDKESKRSAEVSHNHPEGLKGAQAIAFCVYWLKDGKNRIWLKEEVEKRFGYDLGKSIAVMRKDYTFDASAAGSVPQAIQCFLESTSLLQAIGNAVWLGGDMDTIADMAGALGEACYGMNKDMEKGIMIRLPVEYQSVIREFYMETFERKL